MIEREFVSEKIKHYKIKELIDSKIRKFAGVGDVIIEKTPMGEKITIYAVRPGLIIGSGGETVKELTSLLRSNFKLENPQIEIREIERPADYAAVIAKKLASDLERFGASKFKMLGYKAVTEVMRSGAMGVEIWIRGRGVPGARAHSWRFYEGYMKKCGDVVLQWVDKAQAKANLRTGTVGVEVRIMPGDAKFPDRISINPPTPEEVKVEVKVENIEIKEEKTEEKPKKVKKEESKPKEEKPKAESKTPKAKKEEELKAEEEKPEAKEEAAEKPKNEEKKEEA